MSKYRINPLTNKPMRDDDYYYYSIVWKQNGRFDSILNMSVFETKEQCENAITEAIKLDEEEGWEYIFSKPQIIKVVTKDIAPLE